MKKMLCLYYSGVGNTRIVAEFMKEYLEENKDGNVTLCSVEDLKTEIVYEEYDGVIIGFPTIHCSPASRIMDYIEKMDRIRIPVPTFVFTTCGMYQANTTRIFSKKCKEKNLITVLDASYRMPAVDGMLLTKKMHFLEVCHKNIKAKIQKSCDDFTAIIQEKGVKMRVPSFKWYSILNYPNKLLGEHYIFPIYLNTEKCKKCGKCDMNCTGNAMVRSEEGYPVWNKSLCERCYRCIHHCPTGALSLKKKKAPSRIWKPFRIE